MSEEILDKEFIDQARQAAIYTILAGCQIFESDDAIVSSMEVNGMSETFVNLIQMKNQGYDEEEFNKFVNEVNKAKSILLAEADNLVDNFKKHILSKEDLKKVREAQKQEQEKGDEGVTH